MKPRDYTNATRYEEDPAQVKHREERNKARRELEKEGRARKGDGKDVGHKQALANGGSNNISNVKMQSVKSNRGWRRHRPGYSVPNV
jgi:hypothetical protein